MLSFAFLGQLNDAYFSCFTMFILHRLAKGHTVKFKKASFPGRNESQSSQFYKRVTIMAILHIKEIEFGSPNYRTWSSYTSPGMTHLLKVHSQLLNVDLNANRKCSVVTFTKYFFTVTI